MAALDLRTSMSASFDRLFAAENYDLTLNLDKMYPEEKVDRVLHAIPSVLASENWIAADGWVPKQLKIKEIPDAGGMPNTSAQQTDETPEDRFIVIGMPADSKLFVPVMAQGRTLQPGDVNSIVLNPTMSAHNPHLRVGDEVQLHIGTMTKTWRVVGICREPMVPPPVAYIPKSSLDGATAGTANLVKVALKEITPLELAREQIDPALEREGIQVGGGSSKAEYRAAVYEHVLMIYVFLVVASCIIAVVGTLGLVTTMGINILERRREIGVLRAIGATPMMITAIITGEALTVAIASWAAAVIMAFPITKLLTGMIGRLMHGQFDFTIAPFGVEASLVASAAIAISASIVAARSAMSLPIRKTLAYE